MSTTQRKQKKKTYIVFFSYSVLAFITDSVLRLTCFTFLAVLPAMRGHCVQHVVTDILPGLKCCVSWPAIVNNLVKSPTMPQYKVQSFSYR